MGFVTSVTMKPHAITGKVYGRKERLSTILIKYADGDRVGIRSQNSVATGHGVLLEMKHESVCADDDSSDS